ncbi:hypothetical protein [Candidatus Leptofilum sp.]|uniref:hypothetical protein n=1 Tax=Candidatus Leptofilum sp. TaxID=3241576 RepID=UPI003B5B12D3
MSEQIQIALDPELGIDPETLIAAWNGDSQTSNLGELTASTDASPYYDPTAIVIVLNAAVAIASGILTSLLTDLIKDKYLPKKPEIIEIHQPDGQKIVIVKKK